MTLLNIKLCSFPQKLTTDFNGLVSSINFWTEYHLTSESERLTVQSLSRVGLFATPWTAALSVTNFSVHQQLPELSQIHVHQVGDAVQPPHFTTGHTGLAVGWVLWVTVDIWPEWGRSGGK